MDCNKYQKLKWKQSRRNTISNQFYKTITYNKSDGFFISKY